MLKKTLRINGLARTMIVDPERSLADTLRQQLLLTGCKVGCNQGQCGACSVLLDGKVVRSCVLKMRNVEDGASVLTIEGLGTPGRLHPLQLAWMANGAVQCGFCSPGFILSAAALLDANPDPSREQVREWFQTHRNACRCTGYKPLVDAVMNAAKLMRGELRAEDLVFRTPRAIATGASYHRPSDLAKVTGTLDYGADLAQRMPPGTLRLALVQSECSHARIVSVDISAAERMPGVYKVITRKDITGTNRIVPPPGRTGPADGGERPILCDGTVFQFGDTIAIVAADTEAHAREAARRTVVEYEALPAYMSAPAALSPDSTRIHAGVPNEYFVQRLAKGRDAKSILKRSLYAVEGEYYCSRQPHLTIEPDCGEAYFAEDGTLVIHSKSAAIRLHASMIADGLGVAAEGLRLVENPSGGAFGYKYSPTVEALLGAACLATGKPVSLSYSMFQSITYTGKRSPAFMKLRLGADEDGRFTAMESDWTIDHGPYLEFGDILVSRPARFIGAGYDIPNIRGTGRAVATNHAWGAAFRAFGAAQSFLASECLIDELAEEMGLDPFELRFRNIYRPGSTTPTGCHPDVYCLESMFELLRPRYEAAKERKLQAPEPRRPRGVGLALGVYGRGASAPPAYGSGMSFGRGEISTTTGQGDPCAAYAYELFMPEVEVDIDTGKTRVLRFTTVVDVGTIINRNDLDGQILGGLAQGIGLALSEDFEDPRRHSTLVACGLPYAQDVPDDIEIVYHVTPRTRVPGGSAGAGEISLTAPHAAILNAIHDACGIRIRTLPALPGKIRAALASRERRS